MARMTTDHDMERMAKRLRAEAAEREADRLFRMALLDMEQDRRTPDDYAPGCDAHDHWSDR